ncbi:complex I subunit 5 family protein [Haloglomus litoreum]|uniref:complex I subunit 5 family protein n=1 Tax=Haloglomus litoreum TaxID=3034026 RepID=UPI0023E885F0|nr:proton-conducting transporter membrane subunit [Haloglomus sp. DT116]
MSAVDPTLLVALPLLASVVPPMLAFVRDRAGWPVALVTLLAQTALAATLAVEVVTRGPVVVEVGNIPAPFGIRLVVDALSAPFVLLVAVVALAVLGYTRVAGPRSAPFYGLYLLLVAGLTGVCLTADLFNLYVFLEISGLASYALVARSPGGDAAVAALRYLLLGTVGASLYLFGVGYAYLATGTLSMAAFGARVAGSPGTLVLAAFALVAAGLGVKMALYPLHTWKPPAYAAAPTGVSALLAALASTVAAYALARLLLSAFGATLLERVPAVRTLLLTAAVVSIVAGALLAAREPVVRRRLAYSSVSQFGIVLVGVALASSPGVTGAVVHLVGHAVMKGGAFLAAGLVATQYGAVRVDDYAGLARRAPAVSAALAVLLLGLVGIPPTVGFAGKFYVALAAAEAGAWIPLAAVVASTLFSLAYLAPLLQRMYVEPPAHRPDADGTADGHGGDDHDGGDTDGAPAAPGDGASGPVTAVSTGEPGTVSVGMVAVVVAAGVATVVLGAVAPTVEALLAPFLEVVL